MIIILGLQFCYVYLPTFLYNSNFKFFEIKPLVPLTSNSRDSTVYPKYMILSYDVASWSDIMP